MTAPLEDSITRAQDEGRDATESQSETQPHTARRSARNTAPPHLPAPSRVGAATEVHVPNSAQRLSDEDRRTDAHAEIADPQSAQIEASAPDQPPVRRSRRVRTRAAAAGTRNIAAGQENTDTSDGSDSSGSSESESWRCSASDDRGENAARESPLRDSRKRLHHSAEIREGPYKRALPSSEAGASQREFVRDTGDGEEEDAERDESSESEDDTELQFFVPDHGIVYKDLFNVSCSLPVSDLSSFAPGDPLPERILHFLAQHILRAEATGIFPNTLDMVWFRDSCFSSWVSSRIEMDDATRRSEGSIKFSEHDVGLMRAAGQVDIVMLPFLADGHNSLFVVEGLNEFLEHTRAIIGAGRDVEETLPDAEPPESREVFSYCLRRRGSLRSYSTGVHHVGGGVEVHEKYRSAFRSWIERVLHDRFGWECSMRNN